MINYILSIQGVVDKFLKHIATSSIADLLLKIISIDDMVEGTQMVKVLDPLLVFILNLQWFHEQKFIPRLLENLHPTLDSETHTITCQTILDIIAISYQNVGPPEPNLASQNQPLAAEQLNMCAQLIGGNLLIDDLKRYDLHALGLIYSLLFSETSIRQLIGYMLDREHPNGVGSLISGVNIIIELIRRYCSEIEQVEYQFHHYEVSMQQTRQSMLVEPSPEKVYSLSMDLNQILSIISENISEFASILENPRSVRFSYLAIYRANS